MDSQLTPREEEIVELMLDGLSNREIASQLHLAYETIKWYSKQIYRKSGVKNRAELSAAYRAKAQQHSAPKMPVPLTPLMGRDKELAELKMLLTKERLLVIVGPGGIGKTRLALALLQTSDMPARFLTLAQIDSLDTLVFNLASLFNITLHGHEPPLRQLLAALPSYPNLLVLDNFETLPEAASLLMLMLEQRPQLQLLVTSRTTLGLQLEHSFLLEGLGTTSFELFNERAQRRNPTLDLQHNSEQIKEICALVGGNPLAIELAASWVRLLSCQQIMTELQQGLALLTTTFRDIDQRHRSMAAVCQQSWHQLPEREQSAFLKLTSFTADFSLAAAQMVAQVESQCLLALVDKSMLQRETAGRLAIHPVLRTFGREQVQRGDVDLYQVQKRHADFFISLLIDSESDFRGVTQVQARQKLEQELGNILQAWRWSAHNDQLGQLDKAIQPLARFFEITDRSRLGAALFKETLASKSLPASTKAMLQLFQGWHEIWLGNSESGSSQMFTALEKFAALGIRDVPPLPLATLSFNESFPPDKHALLRQYYQEAQTYFQKNEAQWSLGWIEYGLGNLDRVDQQLEASENHLLNSQRRFRATQDLYGLCWATDALSTTQIRQHKLEEARTNAALLQRLSERLQYNLGMAIAFERLGIIECATGRPDEAYNHFYTALQHAAQNTNATTTVPLLLEIGRLLAQHQPDHFELAVQLLAFVQADPSSSGWFGHRQNECAYWLNQLRRQLPAERFSAAFTSTIELEPISFVETLFDGLLPTTLK